MKILKLLFVLGGFMFFASCGGDDCVQADWVGTFTLDTTTVSSTCDLGIFPTTLTIVADSTDAITINGTSYTGVDDCEVGFSALGAGEKFTLSGTSLDYLNVACTATYNK